MEAQGWGGSTIPYTTSVSLKPGPIKLHPRKEERYLPNNLKMINNCKYAKQKRRVSRSS